MTFDPDPGVRDFRTSEELAGRAGAECGGPGAAGRVWAGGDCRVGRAGDRGVADKASATGPR